MDQVALFALLATGALAGTLGGLLGIGGGSIIVPALIALFTAFYHEGDWIAHQAVATSLATVIATGTSSTFSHHRRGAVAWSLVGLLGGGLAIGAGLGALAGGQLAPGWLQRIFGLFLLYAGLRLIIRRGAQRVRPLPHGSGLAGTGTLFGGLAALLGIGGGILVVPFLARRGVPMHQAVGTASACGLPIAIVGTIGFVIAGWDRPGLLPHSLGFLYWPGALVIVAASIPGANLGARLAHRLPVIQLRRIFAALVLCVGAGLLAA